MSHRPTISHRLADCIEVLHAQLRHEYGSGFSYHIVVMDKTAAAANTQACVELPGQRIKPKTKGPRNASVDPRLPT
jgi:hypothetical protein